MTPARAKEVLEGMGLRTFNETRLVCGVHTLYVESNNNYVAIDHVLKPEQLQAIALWMQDPEGVTNAQTNTVEVVRDE